MKWRRQTYSVRMWLSRLISISLEERKFKAVQHRWTDELLCLGRWEVCFHWRLLLWVPVPFPGAALMRRARPRAALASCVCCSSILNGTPWRGWRGDWYYSLCVWLLKREGSAWGPPASHRGCWQWLLGSVKSVGALHPTAADLHPGSSWYGGKASSTPGPFRVSVS